MKPIDPQAAIEEMWRTAPRLAKAKAERIYVEEYRKSLKAILMKACSEQSAVAQEREAYADPSYVDHLKALKEAVEAEETLRWKMVSLEAAVEVWRSQEASNRAIDKTAR
jgi:hypothetical protein